MNQQQHYQQDTQIQIQRDLERVISKATSMPITENDAELLRWACGLTSKENHGNS
jgi:hypothetical protein